MTFLPKLFEMAYTNTQFNRIQKKKLLEKKVESLKLRHKTHSQRYIKLLLAVSKFDLSFLDNKKRNRNRKRNKSPDIKSQGKIFCSKSSNSTMQERNLTL